MVGAGIVGLAVAAEFLRRRPDLRLLVLEKETRVGSHQSTRNSGVIHSGVYYRPGTLKARLCLEGSAAMREFCRRESLPLLVCGKLILASETFQLPRLEDLHQRSVANGLTDAAIVGPERLREIEPHATGLAALHVPTAAVTDYGAVTRRLAEIVATTGGEIATGARLLGLEVRGAAIVAKTTAGDVSAGCLVNCAGLHADTVAEMAGARTGLRIVPFRGEYHQLRAERRHLVRGLIYPVPDPDLPFLGAHLTTRVDGAVLGGPNAVLALGKEGYRWVDVHPGETMRMLGFGGFWRMARQHWATGVGEAVRSVSRRLFARELQRLVPELSPADLVDAAAGVRAQALDAAGRLVDDFVFVESAHMTHVLNVPSPAATASLAIAKMIVDRIEPRLPSSPRSP
ncbi:MAG TPA: L-2-hydroxyglutarate oxidase [Patescibacteria group bacterium]|nr:L-2-hydroxyglutarate oxidase [Patescibacteria group bacterium]